MDMSLGSASELEYHLLLAKDLAYLEEPAWTALTEQTIEVKRMLAGFLKSLRTAA
jgi:four helix bundle protein